MKLIVQSVGCKVGNSGDTNWLEIVVCFFPNLSYKSQTYNLDLKSDGRQPQIWVNEAFHCLWLNIFVTTNHVSGGGDLSACNWRTQTRLAVVN